MSDPPVLGDPFKGAARHAPSRTVRATQLRCAAAPARAELPADYAALHVEVLKRLHTVLALPAHLWEKRSDEAGVSIALHTPPNSPHVMVRSEVMIRMAPERTFCFYMVSG